MAESFGRTVVEGWRGGLRSIYCMPGLSLTTFLLLLGVYIVTRYFAGSSLLVPTTVVGLLLKSEPINICDAAIFASLLIAVHRFVILNEMKDRPVWEVPTNYRRFAVWLFLVNQLFKLPLVCALLFNTRFVFLNQIIQLATYIIILITFSRLLLLFPALALGSQSAGWRNSWIDSRGHFWRFLGALMTVSMPAFIVFVTVTLWLHHSATQQQVAAIVSMAVSLVCYCSMAAIVSRFYMSYGNALVGKTN
jgi:hypothetical protein